MVPLYTWQSTDVLIYISSQANNVKSCWLDQRSVCALSSHMSTNLSCKTGICIVAQPMLHLESGRLLKLCKTSGYFKYQGCSWTKARVYQSKSLQAHQLGSLDNLHDSLFGLHVSMWGTFFCLPKEPNWKWTDLYPKILNTASRQPCKTILLHLPFASFC